MSKIKIGDAIHYPSDNSFGVWYPESPYIGNEFPPTWNERPIPTLHLPIGNDAKKYGGCWFDMILSGVKKEEYREFKVFYAKRFCTEYPISQRVWGWALDPLAPKESFKMVNWKVLHLTNGYGHDKPQLWAHIESITIGRGKPEWGAPTDRDVFIIKLGEVFHTKNLKQ